MSYLVENPDDRFSCDVTRVYIIKEKVGGYGFITFIIRYDLSRDVRKPDFCIYENKAADQLCGNRTANQRLCFRYTDSTIPLLPKFDFSSL